MAPVADREHVELGKTYILSILQREHAASPAVLEARSSERDGTCRVLDDVNHVVTARDELLRDGQIAFMPAARTRGGHEVPIYHLPTVRGSRPA